MFVFVPLLLQISKVNIMLALLVIRIGQGSRALFAITFGEEVLATVMSRLIGEGGGTAYRLDIELFYIIKKTFRFLPKSDKKEVLNEVHNGDPRDNSKAL